MNGLGAAGGAAAAVMVVGVGSVGTAAARHLRAVGAAERILLVDRRRRAGRVARDPGIAGETVAWRPGQDIPEGVAALVVALPPGPELRVVRAAVEGRVPVVTVTDDAAALAGLLELGPQARAADTPVVVGAGLAPGLADVLARHAADAFDAVEEIHVARSGVAGPSCRRVAEGSRGRRAFEWRDGVRTEVRRRGPELVWFPDPAGALDCTPTTDGLRLLARAFPEATLLSARRSRAGTGRMRPRPWRTEPPLRTAALRVRVWGRRGAAREVVEYGAVGDAAVLAGALAGVLAGALARRDDRLLDVRPGVMGPAEVVRSRAVLAALASLGVHVAVFEGVPVR